MADETNQASPYPETGEQDTNQEQDAPPKPKKWQPGELTPFWYSSFPNVLNTISEQAKNALGQLCDTIGNKDVAARRWEVEQSWEARLFDRGYQYLLPRKGGGWILPPFSTDYNRSSGKRGGKFYGYETNIYATYGEIITAALTRDVPEVRFEPNNPENDADITAKDGGTKYARCFARKNDLLNLQQQLVYYLRTDGRSVICVDHILDKQRFGTLEPTPAVVPETEGQADQALLYLVRHGETEANQDDVTRGRSDVGLDPHGAMESADAGAWLKNKGVGRIVSSPLPRAMQSADKISQATGVPVETDDRFASMDIGDEQGEPTEEAGKEIAEHADNSEEPMPGGESFDDLDGRVQQGLMDHLQNPNPQKPTAIVTHDSVISSAFRTIHGKDQVPPTDMVPPGGAAGIYAAPGGGFTIRAAFPTAGEKGVLPAEQSDPRGEELAEVYGKLEAKVPINAQTIHDCPWIQISKEYDYAFAKAMFSDYADEIKPGSAGAGENELDRIARINACLALEASYVTGDSMVRDCTIQRTWMRPGFFMEVSDIEVRNELFQFFPDGCLVIYAGEAVVLARNENLDDHLTIVQAYPGSGMNRMALCSKLLSVQKRVNNWIDLINDYFIRTIPQRVADIDMYNPEAIQDQPQSPGDYIFVKRQGANLTLPIADSIFVEPTPTHQPSMPDFIKLFLTDLPQLLTGALPALFGSESNTDTATGIAIQRDQALGRLGTPWHAILMATCSYFKQAVQLAARCRKEPIRMAGDPGEFIRIELSDLKGSLLCYPVEDSNFPESWNQRQARYQALLTDAATNPFIASLLTNAANAKFAQEAAGMEGFIIPQAESWEKQLGEFELLLQGTPLPNPAKLQAAGKLLQAQASGQQIDPNMVQQAAALPDMISSVPVDQKVDDNATEAACCKWWLNNPDGRKYKNGTQQERDAYQNVRLHFMEHEQAAAADTPPAPQKPMSVSANVKDMPPRAAAAELAKRGLPATPQEVAAEQTQGVSQ